MAAGYVALHLPFLAPSLEDVDSINFALGLRDFDPALHQPHPPGSPVYIVLGRLLLAIVALVRPDAPGLPLEAWTLAAWSAIAGAAAIVAAVAIVGSLSSEESAHPRATAFWAAALMASAPLFWISGLRPMSDLPGLAAALGAQALLLRGCSDRQRLVQGAVVAGLAAGLRVQTVLLTMPVLLLALIVQRRAGIVWVITRPVAALAVATLAWLVPLVADSGGPAGYLRALGSQAGEDFAWVDMLWMDPSPRRLAFALYETFVLPWGHPALAAVVAGAALAGAVSMLARERRPLLVLFVMFAPYTLFHLMFHETAFVRYGLPVVPLVAWLAARGLAAVPRAAVFAAAPVAAAALLVAVPAGVAYGGEAHPAFRAIGDASRLARTDPPSAVYSHFGIWRALQADAQGLPVVVPRRQYEWTGPQQYWKDGGTAPVWFLADPRRTDLALIDPRARRDVSRYAWAVADRPELSGTRPIGADWYRMSPPGWFAGEGWSLTPETGGLALATAAGPDHAPIEAWIRRRSGPLHMVIGGRHLGVPGDPPADFELAIDDVVRDRWRLTFEERNFLRFLDLPDGVEGQGPYARLTIAARGHDADGRRAPVGIRQFDVQAAGDLIAGFGDGWHEEEFDPATGRRWRWTSGRSVWQVRGGAGGVRLVLRGESPLRYFDAPPTVRVTAGGRVIDERHPDADFDWTIVIPADDVARGGGAIVVETEPVYLPGEAEGTADERRLGLRLFESRLEAAQP